MNRTLISRSLAILAGSIGFIAESTAVDSAPSRPEAQTSSYQSAATPDAIPRIRPKPTDGSSERLLVLQNGTVLRGIIEKSFAGYGVTKPQGKLVISADQVRAVADNLEDAYLQLSKTLPNDTASAHIDLARWCIANELFESARRELLEALKLDPESQIARNLKTKVDDQLLATRELPTVKLRDGRYSMLGDSKPLETVEALGGLPREVAGQFSSKVQPLLVNRCATAGCHGVGSGQEFELHRVRLGHRSPRSHSEQNLSEVLERIDRDRPLSSPLLIKLRGEPHAKGLRVGHGGLTTEQTQVLRQWVMLFANKIAEDPAAEQPEQTSSSGISNLGADKLQSKPKLKAETKPILDETELDLAADPAIPPQNEPRAK